MSLPNKEQTLFLRDSTLFLLKDGVEYQVSNPEIIAFNFVPPYEWPGNVNIVHQIKDSAGWVTTHELMYSKFPDDRRRIVARLLPKEKKEMDHSMDAVPYMLGGIPDKGAMGYTEGDYKQVDISVDQEKKKYIEPQEKSTKHCGGINCPFEYSCIDGCMYPKPIISAPVESQEELSKFSNSKIGSHHWAATLLSFGMRVGEYLKDHGADKKEDRTYHEWGKQLYERLHEVNIYLQSLPDKD